MPIRDTKRIHKKLKKSYVYIETVPEVCVCIFLPEGDTHTGQRVSFYALNQAMLHRIIYSAGSDAHINIRSLYELVNVKHNYWNSWLSII